MTRQLLEECDRLRAIGRHDECPIHHSWMNRRNPLTVRLNSTKVKP